MIRAWCRSGPNVQKGLIYVKYVEPQTFYQWCCVGSSSGGVLVTIPCIKRHLYAPQLIKNCRQVAKDDANLALSSTFRQVFIESL
ncbi:hypothetical protein TNCV_4420891 [Trichonephila clavipes]|nr:hypothetical protein TNCV_4420891 [Trichonephila clavipes]